MLDFHERLSQVSDFYRLKSTSDFAKKIGISHQAASNYIKGKQQPTLEVIAKISQAFSAISADWLLTGEGPMLKDGTPAEPKAPQSAGTSSEELKLRIQNELLKEQLAEAREEITQLRVELLRLKEKR